MGEVRSAVSGDITVHHVAGVLSAAQVMAVLEKFYAGRPTLNVVWHLPAGSTWELTSDDLRNIVQFVRGHAHTRPGGRTAIVAPADLEFGMARMICIFADALEVPLEAEAFRHLGDAAKWMGVATLPAGP